VPPIQPLTRLLNKDWSSFTPLPNFAPEVLLSKIVIKLLNSLLALLIPLTINCLDSSPTLLFFIVSKRLSNFLASTLSLILPSNKTSLRPFKNFCFSDATDLLNITSVWGYILSTSLVMLSTISFALIVSLDFKACLVTSSPNNSFVIPPWGVKGALTYLSNHLPNLELL